MSGREIALWGRLGSSCAGLLLSGCLVGPNYERPQLEVPPTFVEEGPQQPSATEPCGIESWWEHFEDPLLNKLVALGMEHNLDLQHAVANIAVYRADYCVDTSRLYPHLDGHASYDRIKINNIELGGEADQKPFNAFTYGLSVPRWELDFFGKIRRQIEATRDRFEASVEEWRQVLVSLQGDIVSGYISLRTLQARKKVLEDTVEVLSSLKGITAERQGVGTVAQQRMFERDAQLALAEAEIPVLEAEIVKQRNGLAVLLGIYPQELPAGLFEIGSIPKVGLAPELGIPAALILRRPDVRQAERLMAAEVASIGVAEAGYYPEISLAGDISIFSGTLGGLGNLKNLTYRVGPNIHWNLFNAGRTRAEVARQRALAEGAEKAYRKKVLSAVEQVETAAAVVRWAHAGREQILRAVDDGDRAFALEALRVQVGGEAMENLLSNEKLVLNLYNTAAQAEGAYAQALVRLFRSLGGGWERVSLPAVAQPSCPPPKGEPRAPPPSSEKTEGAARLALYEEASRCCA